MEVTETLSDGLKREFQVKVSAPDLEARVSARLDEIKGRVQMPGFRPGKVPVTHLKKLYGRSIMAETIEAVVREINSKIVEERGLKLAMEPKVTLPEKEEDVEKLIGGKSDLAYTLALEVLPKIELADFKGVSLERLVTDVTDAEVEEALGRIADQNRPYSAKEEGAKVEKGDRALIDFTGRIDGKAFEGGSGGDVGVNVGSGTFIPGFEDQLIGAGVGETKLVKVTFPVNYMASQLAGKDAEFDVTVKSIEAPGQVAIDDAFAKGLGLESLDKLKEAVKGRIAQEHGQQSRQKLKRQLLDALDEKHQFALPPTLAEEEFKNVWTAVETDLKQRGSTFEQENTTEEKARGEYKAIAERRVRLGLVLAEIGERNGITVSEDEIKRAIFEQARQMPGREKEVIEFYQKNPQQVAAIRAPIYEEKVVNFLVELAKVTDKTVSREELYQDDEEGADAKTA